jgi:hypothetical protein
MNKTAAIILCFFLFSCSGETKKNTARIKNYPKIALLTYYHALWILNDGDNGFLKTLDKISRVYPGYKGFSLLKNNLSLVKHSFKKKHPHLVLSSTDFINGAHHLDIYDKENITGSFYFVKGTLYNFLPFEGNISNKKAIASFLKAKGFSAALALNIDIRLDFSKDLKKTSDKRFGIILNVIIKSSLYNNRLIPVKKLYKTYQKKIEDFSPDALHTLGITDFITDFLKSL